MGKTWAILGLALLAGCSEDRQKYDTVTVSNTGKEAADGTVQDWDGYNVHHISLDAGESVTVQLEVSDYTRIKVHLERTSDKLVLIDDFWDYDQISNHELDLTVSP